MHDIKGFEMCVVDAAALLGRRDAELVPGRSQALATHMIDP